MTSDGSWPLNLSAGPIFVQIARCIREQLARGELRPDDKLPSARDLAATLGVNPNTIVHAYGELEAEGIVEVRRGLGTFVRQDAPVERLRRAMLRQIATRFVDEARRLGVEDDEAAAALEEARDAR